MALREGLAWGGVGTETAPLRDGGGGSGVLGKLVEFSAAAGVLASCGKRVILHQAELVV
jgi:hypothetical protein